MKNVKVYSTILLFCSFGLFAQTLKKDTTSSVEEKWSKYVWKIIIQRENKPLFNNKKDNVFTMTGFKVKGSKYLVTALHGLAEGYSFFGNNFPQIRAEHYSIDDDSGPEIEYFMEIKGYDFDKDLLFLEFFKKNLITKVSIPFDPTDDKYVNEGLLIGTFNNKDNSKVYKSYGYTNTVDLKKFVVNPSDYSKILNVVNNSNQIKLLDALKSPNLVTEIVSLDANDIKPGFSGCPIVDINTGEIIGIGNGQQLLNDIPNTSWAIKLNNSDFDETHLNNLSNYIKSNESKQKLNDISAVYKTFHTYKNGLRAAVSYDLKYNIAAPNIIVSMYYKPKKYGIDYFKITGIESKTISKTEVFDISVDFKPFKKIRNFMLGAFGTQANLNYTVTSTDENNLPPNIGAKNYQSTNTIIGLQSTILISQGILHHLYIGTGFGANIKNLNVINNIKFFTGYRIYFNHNQRLSADAKILYTSTKETFLTANPYGNALPKLRNLNQYYLCLGLNYSIKLQK